MGRVKRELSLRSTEKEGVRFHSDQKETGDQKVTGICLHSILVPQRSSKAWGEKAMGDLERQDCVKRFWLHRRL